MLCSYLGLYYIIAFLPVIGTFFVSFLPTISYIGAGMLLITILYGTLNGVLEELFWRYTFNEVCGENVVFAYIIPTILFTSWHFALLLCKRMAYYGGAPAAVGGAAGVMGMLWGYVMFRTKNVKITIAAHVVTNIFAFSQLIYEHS